jgi:hypothetical protein
MALVALLHPHPTLRSHVAALAVMMLHPDLLLGYYDSTVRDDDDDDEEDDDEEDDNHKKGGVGEEVQEDGEDGNFSSSTNTTTPTTTTTTTTPANTPPPLIWSWTLRGVACLGHALSVTGVLVMWRMWVGQAAGRGNANYLYFQSLGFQTFQSLLVCGFAASAVRRNERTALGESRAQVALCCATRRWLLKRRRRQRRSRRKELLQGDGGKDLEAKR